MITTATILEEMTRDLIEFPMLKINYKEYETKIKKYEPTFDGMMEDFEDTVFGVHYNRRNKDTFIEMLATEGWKYFTIHNLNELFSIMLSRHGTVDVPESEDEVDIIEEVNQCISVIQEGVVENSPGTRGSRASVVE